MQCNNSFVQRIKRGVELLEKETADKRPRCSLIHLQAVIISGMYRIGTVAAH